MKAKLFIFLMACIFSASTYADTCFVSYAQYEAAVPHFDIHTCPDPKFEKDKGFCRLGLEGDRVLVYHFEMGDNASCLVAVDKYKFKEFVKKFGARYKM